MMGHIMGRRQVEPRFHGEVPGPTSILGRGARSNLDPTARCQVQPRFHGEVPGPTSTQGEVDLASRLGRRQIQPRSQGKASIQSRSHGETSGQTSIPVRGAIPTSTVWRGINSFLNPGRFRHVWRITLDCKVSGICRILSPVSFLRNIVPRRDDPGITWRRPRPPG